MTLFDYMMRDGTEQWELLALHGTFLMAIEQGEHRFILSAMFGFFVEVRYLISSGRTLDKTEFLYGEMMEKYVPWRQINALIEQ